MLDYKPTNGHRNVVYLKGRIVQKYPIFRGDKQIGVILTLHVGNKNYPQVVCFRNVAKVVWKCYQIDDFITIKGNIQSSHRPGNKISASIFADEILPNNLIADKYYNRFQIQGQILHTLECCDNRLLILVRTITNHVSTVYLRINDFNSRIHCYEKFQPIFVSEGRIETSSRVFHDASDEATNSEEKHYFTNYIVEKIID